MQAGGPAEVGVILCTLSRPAGLRRCLASLAAQTRAADEVVIVRGAPEEEPPELDAACQGLPIRWVDCPGRNLSASRNAGLRACSARLALFMDDDARAEPRWIEALAGALSAARGAWAAGADIVDARDPAAAFEFSRGVVSRTGRQRPVLADGAAPPGEGWFANVKGCGFAVDRARALDLGGFDEFFAFAFEEVDLMVRFALAGGEVLHVPEALVFHDHEPGLYRDAQPWQRDWEVEFRSHLYFCLKHAADPWCLAGRTVVWLRLLKLALRLPERRWAQVRAARRGMRSAERAFAAQRAARPGGR